MKSQQTGSEIPPKAGEDTLAIILECPTCNTQRAFKVNDSFMLTLTRESSGAAYVTQCEICGHRIGAKLAWTKRHLGWVAEKLTFIKSVTVEDDIGMFEAEGEKQI